MRDQLRQKWAMLHRWWNIAAGSTQVAIHQGPGTRYSTGHLAGYYNDLTGKVSVNTDLDERGVPVNTIAGGRRVHFPIAIFQYALGLYDAFLVEGDPQRLDKFLVNAEWALNHQEPDGSWDAFGPIGSKHYTVSSMAQGEAASVLLRAHAQLRDEQYLMAARRAVDFMLCPVERGGSAVWQADDLWLEEYPQIPRRGVLNGAIFSLFGLYDLSLVDASYADRFRQAARSLAKDLPRYDNGYWSVYDLEGRIASPAYHALHVALLRVMAELSGLDEYAVAAERFEAHARRRLNRGRALVVKVGQKLMERSDAVVTR